MSVGERGARHVYTNWHDASAEVEKEEDHSKGTKTQERDRSRKIESSVLKETREGDIEAKIQKLTRTAQSNAMYVSDAELSSCRVQELSKEKGAMSPEQS